MGRRKKGITTCKYPDCTEPRHLWPGGSRATYCLKHYNQVQQAKKNGGG